MTTIVFAVVHGGAGVRSREKSVYPPACERDMDSSVYGFCESCEHLAPRKCRARKCVYCRTRAWPGGGLTGVSRRHLRFDREKRKYTMIAAREKENKEESCAREAQNMRLWRPPPPSRAIFSCNRCLKQAHSRRGHGWPCRRMTAQMNEKTATARGRRPWAAARVRYPPAARRSV